MYVYEVFCLSPGMSFYDFIGYIAWYTETLKVTSSMMVSTVRQISLWRLLPPPVKYGTERFPAGGPEAPRTTGVPLVESFSNTPVTHNQSICTVMHHIVCKIPAHPEFTKFACSFTSLLCLLKCLALSPCDWVIQNPTPSLRYALMP